MKKDALILLLVGMCIISSCTKEKNWNVNVTTGKISDEEVLIINSHTVASVPVTVSIHGDLPSGYKIEGAGVIYGEDSTKLSIKSYKRYNGVGQYDSFYGCFKYIGYTAVDSSKVVSVQISDTNYKDNGDIYSFEYRDILGGEGYFTCPLIDLPRSSMLYIRAFAHISNGKDNDMYVYGSPQQYMSHGSLQDSSVFVRVDALGIGVSTFDVELRSGADAMYYCSNVNFYASLGGYMDWRVPTLHELEVLYTLRNSIGGFSPAKYFSSQLYSGSDIYYWYWDFSTNEAGYEQLDGYSSQRGRLRLVRDL